MAGGKQTPRQAMIGMMYLVLLAMLAMNASKDLLNAFIFLEDGIDVTTKNFNNTNQTIYDKISTSAASGAKVAIQANKNAQSIAKASNALYSEIDNYKKEIIEIGGGLDEETGVPIGKDNQDVGAEYLIVKGHGETLKQKIGALKKQLITLVDSRDTGVIHGIQELLDTPEHVDYEGVTSP
jgi:gliding motility-associated protein GldM